MTETDSPRDPLARFGEVPLFRLTSTDIQDGQPLAAPQLGRSAGGQSISPQLEWSGFPAATQGFAVTVYDPDAPSGSGYWHWAVYNLSASVTSLPTGAGALGGGLLPRGAQTLPNDVRQANFLGASPPEGTGVHRYQFIVHAVDAPVFRLDQEATPAELGLRLHFHVLGRAIIETTAVFGGAAA